MTVFSDVAKQATKITRNGTNGSPELPMLNASLATTRDARVFAAQQALSETGKHRDYTIETELYPDENMHLANFGDVWKAHDPRGIWFGTVTGVKIDVSEMTETSSVKVTQLVSLDSYTGD